MAQLIVRQIGEAVKERLRARAVRHERSLEAEVRAILIDVASQEPPFAPSAKLGFGAQMAAMFDKRGLTAEERAGIDRESRRVRQSKLKAAAID